MKKFINKFLNRAGYTIVRYSPTTLKTEIREGLEFVQTSTGDYYLPPNSQNDVIANAIRNNTIFDSEILAIAQKYIKPNTIALDVGSNFGQMALLMAKCVGENGLVYAFEANKFVYGILEKNIIANKAKVKPFFGAVHNKSEETLYFPEPDFAEFSTYGSYGIDYANSTGNAVPTLALDTLEYPLPVSFMKIDIQGGDLLAMQGAKKIIQKFQMPIIFEYEYLFEDRLSLCFQDYVDFVHSIGYTFVKNVYGQNYLILPKQK